MTSRDFAHCLGTDCERRETCQRYLAWVNTLWPEMVWCDKRLCDAGNFYLGVRL